MLSGEANEVLSNLPANMPTRNSPMLIKLGRAILQLIGWQLVGEIPNDCLLYTSPSPRD